MSKCESEPSNFDRYQLRLDLETKEMLYNLHFKMEKNAIKDNEGKNENFCEGMIEGF